MNLKTLKNILTPERLNSIINKTTSIVKLVLIICISISTLSIITVVFNGGQFDYSGETFTGGSAVIIIYATFYYTIYGTIPSCL